MNKKCHRIALFYITYFWVIKSQSLIISHHLVSILWSITLYYIPPSSSIQHFYRICNYQYTITHICTKLSQIFIVDCSEQPWYKTLVILWEIQPFLSNICSSLHIWSPMRVLTRSLVIAFCWISLNWAKIKENLVSNLIPMK